jgi:hypothetical protein
MLLVFLYCILVFAGAAVGVRLVRDAHGGESAVLAGLGLLHVHHVPRIYGYGCRNCQHLGETVLIGVDDE